MKQFFSSDVASYLMGSKKAQQRGEWASATAEAKTPGLSLGEK